MRRFVLKLLIRWFVNQNRDVHKMTPAKELGAYLFRDSESTAQILQAVMTGYAVLHFEAKTDEERLIMKGGALAIKSLLLNHKAAQYINKEAKSVEKALEMWKSSRVFGKDPNVFINYKQEDIKQEE